MRVRVVLFTSLILCGSIDFIIKNMIMKLLNIMKYKLFESYLFILNTLCIQQYWFDEGVFIV